MQYALSFCTREALRRFASSRAAYAFDFDGTLAPIVTDPGLASMRTTTRLLLSRLARVRPCLVLSGRSQADLQFRLAGTGIDRLVGNHGAEPWEGSERIRAEVPQWERVLAAGLPQLPGLWIENKGISLTVHYRQCRRKAAARAAIAEAACLLSGVRIVGGKQAVSFVSQCAPHKGAALEAELARMGCERALFAGDDDTDEDVFALSGQGLSLFGIRVGRKKGSRAGFFLRNQGEIDELLCLLANAPV